MICQDMSYSFIEKVIDVPGTVPDFEGNFVSTVLYNQPDNNDVKLAQIIKLVSKNSG